MSIRNITVVLVMLLVSGALYAADEPIAGTWKLNLAKTKYDAGAPPKDIVETFTPGSGNTLNHATDRVNPKGDKTHEEFTVGFDGKTFPYKGSPNRDAVAVKRVAPSLYQVTYKKNGEANQINYWVVSKDGKTLTTVSNGLTSDNQPYHRLVVFDKQ